jgi:uncharacterized protein
MTNRERAAPGTISWVDLQTPDLAGARAFYGPLLGWTFAGGDDANTGFYTFAQRKGRNAAGMVKLQPGSKFPPAWSVYLAVDDAEKTARDVVAAGGTVVVKPMDVMDQGRMAFFADPAGAHFGVWQGKQHQGAQIVDENGALVWNEVYSRDLGKARAFYRSVFDLTEQKLDAPGIDYWTLQKDGATSFGAMQMTSQFPPEVPSHWNTYFAVDDADAIAKQAVERGGKVVAPGFDTPYGRMAVLLDPFGASFCVIVPRASSTTW